MGSVLKGLTYNVQTFGCQMNKHDSERISGLLQSEGASEVESIEDADIVVFVTCCVRESAETRLLGHVNSIKNLPLRHGSSIGRRIVAIGGCMGQNYEEKLLERAPKIDVVFGTNNIFELPSLIGVAIEGGAFEHHTLQQADDFPTSLPTKRESPWSAWLPITIGCDNFCTYCIVPYVRGREKSRPLEDIVDEARGYVASGVKEITLLGQNVNSYGRDLYGSPAFAKALEAVCGTGIERLRFATSHPKDLSDDVIALFGKLDALMPALHLPVQSGSNRVLERMNRRYTREHYLDLVAKMRDACPDVALSTDVIVGFPGETDADFEDTLVLIDEVGYNQVFTFIYSPRTGTPAASYPDAVPRAVAQERFDRLFKVVEERAFEANQQDLGKVVPILVEGASKGDSSRLSGRSPRNQNVHAPLPEGVKAPDVAGTILDVKVTEAKTWYLSGEVVRVASRH